MRHPFGRLRAGSEVRSDEGSRSHNGQAGQSNLSPGLCPGDCGCVIPSAGSGQALSERSEPKDLTAMRNSGFLARAGIQCLTSNATGFPLSRERRIRLPIALAPLARRSRANASIGNGCVIPSLRLRAGPGERAARDPGSSAFRATPLGSRFGGNDDIASSPLP
jgi:hypothetical protein